ncbi:MAG: alpha-glucosidase/alpha-galactosidase [Armatimonadetes bacterium CG_4_10_14_3_um_filter_66_18]|nr:alpha-glucosidase/alpha-galactosidase [Armatimonadota bacterium]OIP04197.1 MAG: alpha-glucosidase/alpha-galactosidase [Armatimonadetes bacterium CG2_30_66_41]PIU91888.1 MAG: alpha-glucosidase/alpha-galactosidase [Armatimonadetes bacterium CG06_land_8_20_14_3_00_66_21]PIX37278.1 MAG: alpha-glucosidase/alpha-galactosidase [Armatimonadetes bacterium CG_4_8_14_3_um_filter_66_20]PIY49100.1 MAG: alpha-glucosidase/alpha-galactosidase [Armatimonadetes bacterium CG_4_10_14_3_um_filter_66_18]PIZ47727
MSLKVAFIGAGSVGFTRKLFRDILTVPELQDTEFAFTDLNKRNLEMVAQLCQKDLDFNKLPAKLTATVDRRAALADADYVISVVRVGGLEAFQTDIDIPLKYGVDQCVGDTLCAGGIMYGQRNIPCVLDFCKDMREVSKPDVLFLNYANPNAMNTWAAIEYGGVNTLGLCHGVEGGWHQIAAALGAKSHKEVDLICAGINHQTWYLQVKYKGRLVSGDELLKAFESHPVFCKTEKVRLDILRRFGYYTTESNGHVSEYVPWYRKRPKEIKDWISTDSWINGETGGYLRVCIEGRNWFETDFPQWLEAPGETLAPETRGTEHGSYILEALETGRCYRGHFNVRNNGVLSNLADDCIVEVPGYLDANGINIPVVGDLPLACHATLSASVNVQRMAVKAAATGDLTLLKQALLHDPLTAAVCDPNEVWQMVDEMVVAQAKWLPQYKKDIPKAKKRLATEKPLGTRTGKGAARIEVKTVAQMKKHAAEARALAAASDKAAARRAKDAEEGEEGRGRQAVARNARGRGAGDDAKACQERDARRALKECTDEAK